jgi:hypothetical protein
VNRSPEMELLVNQDANTHDVECRYLQINVQMKLPAMQLRLQLDDVKNKLRSEVINIA